MKKYKIKDEYSSVVKLKYLDTLWVKSSEGTFYMIGRDYDIDHRMPDAMFEEVNERMEVKNIYLEVKDDHTRVAGRWNQSINFQCNELIQYDEIKDTLEAYLNGELK